jgi:sugar phosphate isomerase/epimerase
VKLAASNIAWVEEDDGRVAGLMTALGYEGLEIAPSRVWRAPLEAGQAEIADFRSRWERWGIRVVAMQALLFGRSDLAIFRSDSERRETRGHLEGMIRLGSDLGVEVLVFGSPGNRSVGDRPRAEAERLARAFFRAIGDYAAQHGVCFCIEPNPREYGCDFVTDVASAEALVAAVDSPGFAVHLDSGAFSLTGESIEETLHRAAPAARHYHISEANLVPVGSGTIDHRRMATALARAGYERWVSVEMRRPDGLDSFHELAMALEHAAACYR